MQRARKQKKLNITSNRKPLGETSLIMGGNIYCINQMKNNSPYWGGHTCDSHTRHTGDVVKWVCSSCVANAMPAPVLQQTTPKIDPTTGEKRKRGRPRKHIPTVPPLDENGNPIIRKRGRPKGSTNKVTTTKKGKK